VDFSTQIGFWLKCCSLLVLEATSLGMKNLESSRRRGGFTLEDRSSKVQDEGGGKKV
jgi:hypothetical protein